MTTAEALKSGKGEHDENFPVASRLIAARHRPAVLAYYRFARAADDVADHPSLPAGEKLATLDRLEATLLGNDDREPDAIPLRGVLAERRMSPRHAQDLLTAFRMDCTKTRYADWGELMHYCRYSANPVGRYVLEVHGESEDTWAPNDALCTALQVINHIQDCGKDYRALDRVYMPLGILDKHGARVEMLGAGESPPQLRAALKRITEKLAGLIPAACRLPRVVADTRLAIETETIARLADRLTRLLLDSDPLNDKVHLSKAQALSVAAGATVSVLTRRLVRREPRAARPSTEGDPA